MRACCCTLAGTASCLQCPNNTDAHTGYERDMETRMRVEMMDIDIKKPETEEAPACERCKWFQPAKNPNKTWGYCRIDPPSIYPGGHWPSPQRTDWCGKFEEKRSGKAIITEEERELDEPPVYQFDDPTDFNFEVPLKILEDTKK